MQAWKRVAPDEVIKIGWRTLVRKTFEQPDGKHAEYVTKEAMNTRWGAVIAITKDNKVVVAEQFRQGPEKVFEDLPGGNINPDEDPKEASMRELLEETGYTSTDVEELGLVYQDGYTNALSYFFLARNCEKVQDQKLDDGEFVEVKLISIDELFNNARNGKMSDVAALFFAYDQLKKIQQEGE